MKKCCVDFCHATVRCATHHKWCSYSREKVLRGFLPRNGALRYPPQMVRM
ncbi:MAG: hypothetical protein ACFB10_14395 [Salibacteraceae bacterium]